MESAQRSNHCNVQRMEEVHPERLKRHVLLNVSVFPEKRCSRCPVCSGESPPPNRQPSRHQLPFSTRPSTHRHFNQAGNSARQRYTMDASSTSSRLNFPKGMMFFTSTKEQLLRSRCFTGACSHKMIHDWTVSTSTSIRKRTSVFKSQTSHSSMASLVGSGTAPIPGQSLTEVEGFLERRT